jgi:Zn-dependent peptidase ImmA (M78 family)
MVDLPAKNDIEKISFEVLKNSKSLDIFPTPVDKIVAYSELIVRKDLDVSKIHPSYVDKANRILKRALSKVRGLFDRKQKTIYLDLSQGFNRKNFVKLHETAHGILPWQKKINDILGDDEHTLSPEANEEFEMEANYFASVTLFQHDRFLSELTTLNLSIDAAMHLAKHFGASIHASLRRYVDCSKNRCALLVLENLVKTSKPYCGIRNFLASPSFAKDFGEIVFPPKVDYSWQFVQHYCHGRKFIRDGNIELTTKNGVVKFTYQFFNNGYNAFILFFPVGEQKKSKTTIIVSGYSN